MAHGTPNGEPPEIPPPPLPARNPLRDDPLYKSKRCLFQADIIDNSTTPASPISQDILDELDRELKDTRQRLVSAIYEGNKIHGLWENTSKSLDEGMSEAVKRTLRKRSDDDECTVMEFLASEAGSEGNSSIGCGRCPKTSSAYSQLIREDQEEASIKGEEKSECTAKLQSRRDDEASEPNSTISSYNDARTPSSHYSAEEDEDARAEAWLARGLLSPESQIVEHSKRLSKDGDPPSEAKHHALSPFPPVSPKTGNREYVLSTSKFSSPTCPVSPLNNGRDAYGNHIPSNRRDLFTTQPPPDYPQDQHPLEQERQLPQVHLRGGWELPRPFWRYSGHMESGQGQESANEQERNKRDETAQNSRLDNETKEQQPTVARAVPDVRSQYALDPSTNFAIKDPKPLKPGTTTERYDDADSRDIYGTKAHNSYRERVSDPPDVSPYDDLSYIFNKHFGMPLSPLVPLPSGKRPLNASNPHHQTYGREGIPKKTGTLPPLTDATQAPPKTTSALEPDGFPIYNPMLPQGREERPKSLESESTATTSPSHQTSPRQGKRWNKDLPRTPPAEPAPGLPKEAYPYLAGYTGSQDDESIFSARTGDDNLKGLVELQTSGPYRKAKQAREARRIYEEQERQRREAERDRETDIHTLTPSMSVSQRQVRRPPPAREPHRLGRVPENESFHSSNKTVPRQTTHEQFIQQQYPQSGGLAAPVFAPAAIEPVRNARPNMNSVEMAFHIAGKVTRFLLAAPSDPKLKTYSRRYPHMEDQQRVNAPSLANTSVLERISDVAPSQTQKPRGPGKDNKAKKKKERKDKGKGKAVDMGATTDTRDFAPDHKPKLRVPTHTSNTLSNSDTVVNTNSRYTGITLAGPAYSPSPNPARYTSRNNPGNAHAVRNPTARYEQSDTGTEWPVQDERGNVIIAHRKHLGLGIRGGGGGEEDVRSSFSAASSLVGSEKEGKRKGKRKERKNSASASVWGNWEYALAMHSMGNVRGGLFMG